MTILKVQRIILIPNTRSAWKTQGPEKDEDPADAEVKEEGVRTESVSASHPPSHLHPSSSNLATDTQPAGLR